MRIIMFIILRFGGNFNCERRRAAVVLVLALGGKDKTDTGGTDFTSGTEKAQ